MKNPTKRATNLDCTPNFKLNIVLQSMQNPGRKRKICRENNLNEEVVEKWHRKFLERAAGIFSEEGSNHAVKAHDSSVVRKQPLHSSPEVTPSAVPSHAERFNSTHVRALRKEMQNLLPT